MKLDLDAGTGNIIRFYSQGKVVVNQTTYTASLIVFPELVIPDWPPQRFVDLAAPHFELINKHRPEIVIVGTGSRLRFPHPELTAVLVNKGIGVEFMDTPAACRTYNLLMADGRNVAAAILMTRNQQR